MSSATDRVAGPWARGQHLRATPDERRPAQGRAKAETAHDPSHKVIPTFREYVLVEYRRRKVEVWTRDDAGAWTATTYRPSDDIALTSVAVTLPMDLGYEDSGI